MLRFRTLVITGWSLQPDGSVAVTITNRRQSSEITVTLRPSSSAFSEHLALVTTTFLLAFVNRGIEDQTSAGQCQVPCTSSPPSSGTVAYGTLVRQVSAAPSIGSSLVPSRNT